jgi:hypothetical protein
VSQNKYKRTKRQVRAVLYADGVPSPADRPRYASYGAGVVTTPAPLMGVAVVSEGGGKADQYAVSLTRFAPGTPIPPAYKLISEGAVDD